jgi:hypothetical protein
VLQDLTGAPAEHVASKRARVAAEGCGARLLALQAANGSRRSSFDTTICLTGQAGSFRIIIRLFQPVLSYNLNLTEQIKEGEQP